MGSGYALLASSWFQALYPEKKVRFLNRGVAGDRAVDLEARWQRDCLDLQPNWLSVLVGINETWRTYDSEDPTPVGEYAETLQRLLESALAGGKTRLILCEPFVLPVPPDREIWRYDLDPRIDVVRRLARRYQAIYVPFDGLFAQAAARREPAFWADDGVHPTPAGHALMAQAWLRAVQAL
jgi:lysophospholipase L1-like esterase